MTSGGRAEWGKRSVSLGSNVDKPDPTGSARQLNTAQLPGSAWQHKAWGLFICWSPRTLLKISYSTQPQTSHSPLLFPGQREPRIFERDSNCIPIFSIFTFSKGSAALEIITKHSDTVLNFTKHFTYMFSFELHKQPWEVGTIGIIPIL